jgi:hypothetical protein
VAREGWHADPAGRHELRYFDGDGWTEHVTDAGRPSADPVRAHAWPPPGAIRQSGDDDRQESTSSLEQADAVLGRSRGDRWVVGIIIALVVGLVVWRGVSNAGDDDGGGGGTRDTVATRSGSCPVGRLEVKYFLTGSASSASITIETPGGTSQQAGVDVPLATKSGERGLTQCFAPGSFVYISAQNDGDSGSIGCSIEVDGVTIAQTSSSGAYVIASCDGTA